MGFHLPAGIVVSSGILLRLATIIDLADSCGYALFRDHAAGRHFEERCCCSYQLRSSGETNALNESSPRRCCSHCSWRRISDVCARPTAIPSNCCAMLALEDDPSNFRAYPTPRLRTFFVPLKPGLFFASSWGQRGVFRRGFLAHRADSSETSTRCMISCPRCLGLLTLYFLHDELLDQTGPSSFRFGF